MREVCGRRYERGWRDEGGGKDTLLVDNSLYNICDQILSSVTHVFVTRALGKAIKREGGNQMTAEQGSYCEFHMTQFTLSLLSTFNLQLDTFL